MNFRLKLQERSLEFDSDLKGLKIDSKEFVAGKDGVLIYDQTKNLKADGVRLQMSTNTSTLIPALRTLGLFYDPYFDQRDVVESQNKITFYWNKSKLAAFYNRYSTDELEFDKREPVIRKAVEFLTSTVDKLPLEDETLARALEKCKLLGFYRGFPIFDSSTGFARLQSRLGIHIDPEAIMISSPLDKYEEDVYELADQIAKATGVEYTKKKNRVSFTKTRAILDLLGI